MVSPTSHCDMSWDASFSKPITLGFSEFARQVIVIVTCGLGLLALQIWPDPDLLILADELSRPRCRSLPVGP